MSIDQFIDQYNPLEQLRRREAANSQMRNAIQQILPQSSSQKTSGGFTHRKPSNTGTPSMLYPQPSLETFQQVDKAHSKSDVTQSGSSTKKQTTNVTFQAASSSTYVANRQSSFDQAAFAGRQRQVTTKAAEFSPQRDDECSPANININNNKMTASNRNVSSEAVPVPTLNPPQQHTEDVAAYYVEKMAVGQNRGSITPPQQQVGV